LKQTSIRRLCNPSPSASATQTPSLINFAQLQTPEKLVAYVYLKPPSGPDPRTREEKEKELREEVEKSTSSTSKELLYALKAENRDLNERYFGERYEERF
jgi:hypothetical protein